MPTAIEQFAGGLLVESFIAGILYGMMTTQTYTYWLEFPDDSAITRVTVATVWILETVHSAFCIHLVYTYLILGFGDIQGDETKQAWSAAATVLTAAIIAAVVQSFFIRRIHILSHGLWWVTIILAIILLAETGFEFVTSILAWKIHSWAQYSSEAGPIASFYIGIGLTALLDLLIALAMIYYLQQGRRDIQSSKTNNIVQTLMLYSISTGALTVVASIAIILTIFLVKGSMVFNGLIEIQSKLYSNSILASLNARRRMNAARNPGLSSSSMDATAAERPRPPYFDKKLTGIGFAHDDQELMTPTSPSSPWPLPPRSAKDEARA